MPPTHLVLRLRRVAEQQVDLGRPEVFGGDLDQDFSGLAAAPLFLDPGPMPFDLTADPGEGQFDEFPHGMGFAGREDIVLRRVLLQDLPHAADIVAGMSPIPAGVQIAEIKPVL